MSTDKKLSQLIINKLTQEQFDTITPSNDELYLVEETKEYATVEELATKQDIIDDLEQIRDNASTGANLAPQVAVNTQRIEDLTTARIPDVIYHGTPKIVGGQVSNFSTVNYLQFPFEDISRSLPFDIYFSFTTDDDVTTQQNIIDSHFGIALAIQNSKGVMALSSNGTSWDIGSVTGTNTLLPNTTYYVKYSWTGTEYNASLSTNDQSYVPDMILQSNKSPYKTTIYIGGSEGLFGPNTAHPFKGIINFTKSRVDVNGITVWEGMADVGIASRANVSLTNLDDVGEARFSDLQTAIDTKVGIDDYASINNAGIIKTSLNFGTQLNADHRLTGVTRTESDYGQLSNELIISKGTLNNIKNTLITSVGDTKYQDITDNTLTTTDKTIVGAINELKSTKQDKLISGTNIKTINGETILGQGNFDVSSIEPLSQEEYNRRKEAGELDENKYYSTPNDISLQVLEALYPVGSLYLTTTSTCPLATLGIGTWQLEATDRVLQGAGSRGAVGTTIDESLPNIKGILPGIRRMDTIIDSGAGQALYWNTTSGQYRSTTNTTAVSVDVNFDPRLDASRSSSTYQDNAPVQQDAYLINVFRRIA